MAFASFLSAQVVCTVLLAAVALGNKKPGLSETNGERRLTVAIKYEGLLGFAEGSVFGHFTFKEVRTYFFGSAQGRVGEARVAWD